MRILLLNLICGLLLFNTSLADAIVNTTIDRKVLRLNGNAYMEVKNCPSLNAIDRQLTIEIRFKVNAFTGQWMPLLYKGDGTYERSSYALWVSRKGELWLVSTSYDDSPVKLTSSATIHRNKWYHVAAAIDAESHKMRLFLNAKKVGETAYGSQILKTKLPLRIGGAQENGLRSNSFDGSIDEVRVWNVTRTNGAIRKTMNQSLAGNEAGLVGYWNFDDETANDRASYGCNGSIRKRITSYQRQTRFRRSHRSKRWLDEEDLGGIKAEDGKHVRREMIYVSSALSHGGNPKAVSEGRVRSVIDYLAHWEVKKYAPNRLTTTDQLNVFHLPFRWTEDQRQWNRDWARDSSGVIRLLVRKHNKPIRETFRILADANNFPVMYYDRNGLARLKVITTLIYLALGVSEQELKNRLQPRPHLHDATIREINQHGGINGYLRHIGVSADEVEKVKAILLN